MSLDLSKLEQDGAPAYRVLTHLQTLDPSLYPHNIPLHDPVTRTAGSLSLGGGLRRTSRPMGSKAVRDRQSDG
jgi:hypothetical protein